MQTDFESIVVADNYQVGSKAIIKYILFLNNNEQIYYIKRRKYL